MYLTNLRWRRASVLDCASLHPNYALHAVTTRPRRGTGRCCRTLPPKPRRGGCQRRLRNVESDYIDVRGRIALRKLRIGDGAGRWRRLRQNRGLGPRSRPAAAVAVAAGDERAAEQQDADEREENQPRCTAEGRNEALRRPGSGAPASQVTRPPIVHRVLPRRLSATESQ